MLRPRALHERAVPAFPAAAKWQVKSFNCLRIFIEKLSPVCAPMCLCVCMCGCCFCIYYLIFMLISAVFTESYGAQLLPFNRDIVIISKAKLVCLLYFCIYDDYFFVLLPFIVFALLLFTLPIISAFLIKVI